MILFSSNYIYSDENNNDTSPIRELLEFGIDSEVITKINELPVNLPDDILNLLLERFNKGSFQLKIAVINYLSKMESPSQAIIDLIFNEANQDIFDRNYRISLYNALGKIGGVREGEFLLQKIDDFDPFVANTAADALSKIRDQALGTIILARLKASDEDAARVLTPDIAGKLILSLGEMRSIEAVEYLRSIVNDNLRDKFLVGYSCYALGKIGSIEAIEDIVKAIDHPELIVQSYASNALSLYQTPEVIPALERMLRSNNETARSFACAGLKNNRSVGSLRILMYKFVNDPAPAVRKSALEAILSFGEPGVTAIRERVRGAAITEAVVSQLSEAVIKSANTDSVAFLIEIYNESNKTKRDIIARNAVRCPDNAIDPLIRLLFRSEDYLVRLGAVRSVTFIKNTTLWDDLRAVSSGDQVELVRRAAANILSLRAD